MKKVSKLNKLGSLREGLAPTSYSFSKALIEKTKLFIDSCELPTRKDEHWKYTNVNGLKNLVFGSKPASTPLQHTIISKASHKIKISNGIIHPSNPEIKGVKMNWTEDTLPETSHEDTFDALNLLHCTAAIEIVFDSENSESIELDFENDADTFVFPRIFIKCLKGAKGNVILNYQGSKDNASFTNASCFVEVEENSNLSVHKIQKNGTEAFDLQREYVNQAANSTFTINTFSLSGRMTRNDLRINVNGNNCETFMNGAYTLKGKSHCDNHTTVDHKVAHCYSKELYKGVIDDHSTNVFNGKVFVRKDAQKINAFQSNANILLSETGTINSKPELEIYADDVKCSHGSTTGQLDDEAIFYLRSRGLPEKAAKELLVKAFLGEVLEEVENQEVRSYVEKQIELHFSK